MRKLFGGMCAVAVIGVPIATFTGTGAAVAARRSVTLQGVQGVRGADPAATPRFYTPRPDPDFNVVGPTVKFFNLTATVGSQHFAIREVGTSPSDSAHPSATIPVKVIPLALSFNDGVTLDPTATLPPCAGGGTALNRTVNSGLFKNINTNLGPGSTKHAYQFLEAFRRNEFWFFSPKGPASGNPNYSLRIAATVLPKTTVGVSGPGSVAENCGRGGNVTISTFDSYVKQTLIPSYGANIKTTDFVLILTSNMLLCSSSSASSCGIGGYHSVYQRNGHTQTFGTGYFATNQRFNAFKDTSIMSHEISEWEDDPFIDNATPPWGHIGQVSGCQNNLETGDPLTGTLFNIKTTAGVTSHVQDLAAISWFYRVSPSISSDRKYSLFGTFTTPAKPCS